jgi:hypothetical protein
LALAPGFLNLLPMIAFLRFVGLSNAALWFGATVFFTFAVGPSFFSEPMLKLLGRPHAGAAAQLVLERYFLLHQLCATTALLHLVAEALYLGRIIHRWTLGLLLGLLLVGLIAGYGIQPRLQTLHKIMHLPTSEEEQKTAAASSFRLWHGLSMTLNLIVLGGVWVYLVRVTRIPDTSRYRFS